MAEGAEGASPGEGGAGELAGGGEEAGGGDGELAHLLLGGGPGDDPLGGDALDLTFFPDMDPAFHPHPDGGYLPPLVAPLVAASGPGGGDAQFMEIPVQLDETLDQIEAAEMPKRRLRWTSELHTCFLRSVERLGGPEKATPKAILDLMKVKGVTILHVKSHLQKYRVQRKKLEEKEQAAQAAAAGEGAAGGRKGDSKGKGKGKGKKVSPTSVLKGAASGAGGGAEGAGTQGQAKDRAASGGGSAAGALEEAMAEHERLKKQMEQQMEQQRALYDSIQKHGELIQELAKAKEREEEEQQREGGDGGEAGAGGEAGGEA